MADDDENSEKKVVAYRVDEDEHEQLMLAMRKMQTEGKLPPMADRSDLLRQLTRAFINNPEIIEYGAPESEVED